MRRRVRGSELGESNSPSPGQLPTTSAAGGALVSLPRGRRFPAPRHAECWELATSLAGGSVSNGPAVSRVVGKSRKVPVLGPTLWPQGNGPAILQHRFVHVGEPDGVICPKGLPPMEWRPRVCRPSRTPGRGGKRSAILVFHSTHPSAAPPARRSVRPIPDRGPGPHEAGQFAAVGPLVSVRGK